MAEQDALKTKMDVFDKLGGGGLFLKFQADKPVTLRVLTVDPMVTTKEFQNNGEINISTQFHFIVYNFTDSKAQVVSCPPGVARKIGEIHTDADFGGDIRKVDIKVTPTGEKLTRKYDIQVLPKTNMLTNEQIKEAASIKLDEVIKDGERMSFYDPDKATPIQVEEAEPVAEVTEEDLSEPINLDDIPF